MLHQACYHCTLCGTCAAQQATRAAAATAIQRVYRHNVFRSRLVQTDQHDDVHVVVARLREVAASNKRKVARIDIELRMLSDQSIILGERKKLLNLECDNILDIANSM